MTPIASCWTTPYFELKPYSQVGLKGEVPWSAAITSSSTSLGRVVSGVVWPDPVSPCTDHVSRIVFHVCHVSPTR